MKKIFAFILLFAFCATPNCYAAANYRYNVTQGDNGEIIVGEPVKNIQMTQYNAAYNKPFEPEVYETNDTKTLYGNVSKIGKGKVLKAFTQTDFSTIDSTTGDQIIAVLSENWTQNGVMIAEAGSVITGVITTVNSATGWSKDGALQIKFYKMETPAGEIFSLKAENINIEVEKNKKEIAGNVLKAAGFILAVAAVCSWIAADDYSSKSSHKARNGALVGAGIATAVTTAAAATKQGENITIPANTIFDIVLTDDITKINY